MKNITIEQVDQIVKEAGTYLPGIKSILAREETEEEKSVSGTNFVLIINGLDRVGCDTPYHLLASILEHGIEDLVPVLV